MRRGYKFLLLVEAKNQSSVTAELIIQPVNIQPVKSREQQVLFYVLVYVWMDVSTHHVDHVIVVTPTSLHLSLLFLDNS